MIAYFDTSAVVPLLVDDEPGSDVALPVWLRAQTVITARLMFAEAGAALARAARLGRLTSASFDDAMTQLENIWPQMDVVEIDDALVRTAAALARQHSLRGYDAVHCAAALRIAGPDDVALAGDQALLAAWQASGISVIDTRA